jgi:hypothetical protein
VVAVFAVISLLTTHAVFGIAPPAGMPLWAALILLLVIISVVAWPLKALRHAWYWHAGRGPVLVPPVFWLADGVVALGCAVLAIWCLDRYVPHAHETLQGVVAVLHHAIDTLKQWWAAR